MKIGLLMGSFAGGGAERMMINLARGFYDKGIDTTIYVVNKKGPYLKEIPKYLKIHSYKAKFGVKSILPKIRYTLKNDNLTVLISTQMHINAAVGIASLGLINKPKIIFREANTPTQVKSTFGKRYIYKYAYKLADVYVAVSEGVKEDMARYYPIDLKDINVIYNPVVDKFIEQKSKENVKHPWFADSEKIPVITAMGRFKPQKGFKDLVKAFKIVRSQRKVRLVIFGDYDKYKQYYESLKRLVRKLGLEKDVSFPGFVDNPFSYLKKTSVFVLSSRHEGLPGVLIQAMACGTPVVSTDCPSGPREILENGKYGSLVEVGNVEKLANCIITTLNSKTEAKKIKKRANYFSIERAVEKYSSLV